MSTAQDTHPAAADAKAKLGNAAATVSAGAQSAAQQVLAHPAVKQAQNNFSQYMGQLDNELGKYPALKTFEQRTSVPKTYGVLFAGFTFLCLIFINTLALPVSNVVGFGLPAYLSFRAIESPGHEDDLQWLTYWVVFGWFTLMESVALRVVLHYLPWYFPLKTAFIIWLQLPSTRGAQVFYHAVAKPVLNNLRNKQQAYNSNQYASPNFNPNAGYTTTTSVGDHDKVL